MQLGYTKEQVDAIQRLKNAKNDWERLGLYPGASKYVSLVLLDLFIEQKKKLSFWFLFFQILMINNPTSVSDNIL